MSLKIDNEKPFNETVQFKGLWRETNQLFTFLISIVIIFYFPVIAFRNNAFNDIQAGCVFL